MRLTKKRAIQISIELWTWLAETGREKEAWPGWEKYGDMQCGCALCEYDYRHVDNCTSCSYHKMFGKCTQGSAPYADWRDSRSQAASKAHAQAFLDQLKQL